MNLPELKWNCPQPSCLYHTYGLQVRQAEEVFRICAEREKRLQRVLNWAAGQRERLREWQRPVSRTQVDKALQEWEVWRVLTSQNKGHGYYTACTVCRWGLH